MDFYVIPTLTFRLLYVFVVLDHSRRKIVHIAVTQQPTMVWTAQQLREAKAEQARNRHMLGEGYEEKDLVCCQADGRQFVINNFSSAFRDFVSQAGIGHVRFHDLRHFHATALMSANIHPKVVSERLGHSSIGITLDLYSHCLLNMQEEAARRIDQLFQNAGHRDSSEEIS